MTTIKSEPETTFTGDRSFAKLLLSDGTDVKWRNLYNETAASWQDGKIPAEAMGSMKLAAVIVAVPKSDGPSALVEAVGNAAALIGYVDNEYQKLQYEDSSFKNAVANWWQQWKGSHSSYQ